MYNDLDRKIVPWRHAPTQYTSVVRIVNFHSLVFLPLFLDVGIFTCENGLTLELLHKLSGLRPELLLHPFAHVIVRPSIQPADIERTASCGSVLLTSDSPASFRVAFFPNRY
jgi:hypothetical protein